MAAPLVIVFLASFPAFPKVDPHEEHSLTLIEPADGAIILAGAANSANFTLRYYLSAGSVARLCLELKRAPLRYYRGPMLERDPASFAAYAKGCYAPGTPVTLQNLGLGSYLLAASAESSAGATLGKAYAAFAIAPPFALPPSAADPDPDLPASFVPTYEWAAVGATQSIPSGLEVRMQLHESHAKGEASAADDDDAAADPPRYARIPPIWRLQIYAGVGVGFVRLDVKRHMSLTEVEVGLRRALPMSHGELQKVTCVPRVQLWSGAAERLDGTRTVEQADLFTRRSTLAVKLMPCSESEENEARALAARDEEVKANAAEAAPR